MPPPPFFASYVMATATTTSSASATEVATDVPHAAFLYPAALLTVNNIDVVQVTYETVWKSVNLTVFCEINEEASEFALAKIGQIQTNGTYAVAPIQAGMQIPQFPTWCNLMLCDSDNSTDYTTGVGFTMLSTTGTATTYAMAVTHSTSPSTTLDANTQSHTATKSRTDSIPPVGLTSAAAVSSAITSSAGETSVVSPSTSSGLTDGAKAGIAIGVILGICALAAMIFFFIRMKRRVDKLEDMVALRSTASSVNLARSEKHALEEYTAVTPTPASPMPTPTPAREAQEAPQGILKASESHRNSEDWRRFFGNGKKQAPVMPS